MDRLPGLKITIMTDMAGKPYVEIDGATPQDRHAMPIRMTLWADAVVVSDLRPAEEK